MVGRIITTPDCVAEGATWLAARDPRFGAALALTGALAGNAALVMAGAIWPVLYAAILAAASVWMALRHRSLCGLGAGVALAAMHLPWGAGFLSGLFKDGRP